uniref:Uncharacterized protein n=2 Tax=Neisseria leonii TaxID=2995413 RepID=A0A9X4IDW9_9NEIS|nr:hypothetical protein [Neisseria sp. 51.81]
MFDRRHAAVPFAKTPIVLAAGAVCAVFVCRSGRLNPKRPVRYVAGRKMKRPIIGYGADGWLRLSDSDWERGAAAPFSDGRTKRFVRGRQYPIE